MPVPAASTGAAGQSQWHCISPATRPLNLQVLEITSLSLTIALSLAQRPAKLVQPQSTASSSGQQSQTATNSPSGSSRKKSKRLSKSAAAANPPHYESEVENEDTHSSSRFNHATDNLSASLSTSKLGDVSSNRTGDSHTLSFKELLSKGVMITVNGRPWNQIVAHLSDDVPAQPFQEGKKTDISTESNDQQDSTRDGGKTSLPLEPKAITKWVDQHSNTNALKGRSGMAVISVFGLEPGKEYEVDLKVLANVGEGEPSQAATTNIVTPSSEAVISTTSTSGNRPRANSLRNRGSRSRSNSLIHSNTAYATTSSASPLATSTAGENARSASPAIPITSVGDETGRQSPRRTPSPSVQDGRSENDKSTWNNPPSAEGSQALQIRKSTALALNEKEDLSAQLKKSRRESQKIEAGLKSEVEALKRAMEKSILPDQRSRQKSLALQEQVKQAFAGAEGAEKEHEVVAGGLTGWQEDELRLKDQWHSMQSARDAAREEKDEVVEADQKAVAELDAKLSSITAKFEKHKAKKERLEKENQELRQKLEEIDSARREVEKRNEAIARGLGPDWNSQQRPPPNLHQQPQPQQRGGWELENGHWPASRMSMRSSPNLSGIAGNNGPVAPNFNPEVPFPSRSRQGSIFNNNAPRNTNSTTTSTPGTGTPPTNTTAAAVALATQGIPRGATGGISHLGNPTGFFAQPSDLNGPTHGTSSLTPGIGGPGGSLPSRRIQSPVAPSTSGKEDSVSPMLANVMAAPFMPKSSLTHTTTVATPESTSEMSTSPHEHLTSLVPPQLQHRIYLPRGRSGTSPNTAPRALVDDHRVGLPPPPSSSPSPPNVIGNKYQGNPPAFPPLPSRDAVGRTHSPTPSASSSPPASSASLQHTGGGPSLASIVTRAIIPTHSPLLGPTGAPLPPQHHHHSHHSRSRAPLSRQNSAERFNLDRPSSVSRSGSWQGLQQQQPPLSHTRRSPDPSTMSGQAPIDAGPMWPHGEQNLVQDYEFGPYPKHSGPSPGVEGNMGGGGGSGGSSKIGGDRHSPLS